jgi:hypothetical protein
MKAIQYIFVYESDSKILSHTHLSNHLSEFRHYVVVDADSKCKNLETQERATLIAKLCQLRHQHPDAKILGVSEVFGWQIKPSEFMNSIRREMTTDRGQVRDI